MSKPIPMARMALPGMARRRADRIDPGRHGLHAALAPPDPLLRRVATVTLTYTSFGIHHGTAL